MRCEECVRIYKKVPCIEQKHCPFKDIPGDWRGEGEFEET